ncbi:hypothetical protein HBA92_21510, partial [Ochrobactrum sp. MR28]|nr:hypothetical protein [Ochrobactrum sp. MR28]MBX8818883.1 hypothetical protein [Ochrobactrum sp. MR31]
FIKISSFIKQRKFHFQTPLIKGGITLPLGTAYAVWTGIGAIGSIVVDIVVFREPATFVRLFWISVTLSGIVGLKLTSS